MKPLYPLFINNKYRDIYIIPGTPILYIESFNAIVFSDLHIGFEEALARGLEYNVSGTSYSAGMFIPRIQLKKAIEILDVVFNTVNPRRVIINGDIKHAFDRLLRQERREIRELLDYLLDRNVEEIILIRGNHDNYLPLVLRNYNIELYMRYEIVTSNYHILFTHGHKTIDPRDYDLVIIGHEHPSIRCLGYRRFPVFLKIPYSNGYIICLPAMGPYHPGTQITLDPSNYLSPIIREYGELGKASVILWIKLGKKILSGEDISYINEYIDPSVLSIQRFIVNDKEYVVIEFKNLGDALSICGSVL